MFGVQKITSLLPRRMRNRVEAYFEAVEIFSEVRDLKVLRALGPSGVRGLILQRAKQGTATRTPARHSTYFDWNYPHDFPEMAELYRRAKRGQWDGETLAWQTSVDPLDPDVPLIPDDFIEFDHLERLGVKLDAEEQIELRYSLCAWMLSQFLHGEQGALFAAAQVTEALPFFDGKWYGATQVMDEGRHVEVFHRYLDTKLNKLYQINDNLFVLIDALMTDARWDMKFLGMQIMVEGLALGAVATLYKETREPLLKELLKNVILDEVRHVHYGVLALREQFTKRLSESERREREEWAFEIALLMRNRFLAHEVYDEWFAHKLSRAQWKEFVTQAPGMQRFRKVMFSRLLPNLRAIGLMSPRILPRYEKAGMMQYLGGAAADKVTGDQMIADLDRSA